MSYTVAALILAPDTRRRRHTARSGWCRRSVEPVPEVSVERVVRCGGRRGLGGARGQQRRRVALVAAARLVSEPLGHAARVLARGQRRRARARHRRHAAVAAAEPRRVLLRLQPQRRYRRRHRRARLRAVHAVRVRRRVWTRGYAAAHACRSRHATHASAAHTTHRSCRIEAVDWSLVVARRHHGTQRIHWPRKALGAEWAGHLGRPVVVRIRRVQRVCVGERLHQSIELRAKAVLEVCGCSCSSIHCVSFAFPPFRSSVFEPYL